MTPSIMQDKRECYATGSTHNLHRHHCFKASRRKLSEKYGLWVWLRADVHQLMHDHNPPYEKLEDALKIAAQRAFEDNGGTCEEFMAIFGCNYL